jgi:hypothetical protein
MYQTITLYARRVAFEPAASATTLNLSGFSATMSNIGKISKADSKELMKGQHIRQTPSTSFTQEQKHSTKKKEARDRKPSQCCNSTTNFISNYNV